MLCIDIRSSYIYEVFSPPLKVIQYFEHDLIEIYDRIFDFYPGVPHMHVNVHLLIIWFNNLQTIQWLEIKL